MIRTLLGVSAALMISTAASADSLITNKIPQSELIALSAEQLDEVTATSFYHQKATHVQIWGNGNFAGKSGKIPATNAAFSPGSGSKNGLWGLLPTVGQGNIWCHNSTSC